MTVDPPGTVLLAVSTLLSPFAIPRNSLRNFGDVLFEPVSACLSAVALLIALRKVVRNRAWLYLLLFLGGSLAPGFVSTYDRPSLTRVYGATVPLAVLSAVGFASIVRLWPDLRRRLLATLAAPVVIAASGVFVFDIVNPRILSSSTWGLLMRSVDVDLLDRVAMISSGRSAHNPLETTYAYWLWESDWLMTYHPYVHDLARCAPRRPVAIVSIDDQNSLRTYDILFWSPALDQTIRITETEICRLWPDAALYTIYDRAGLSRVYAAQINGTGWRPSVPDRQWGVSGCDPQSIAAHDATFEWPMRPD
jgi:hypothetical protein